MGAHLAGGPSQLVSKLWLNIKPVSWRPQESGSERTGTGPGPCGGRLSNPCLGSRRAAALACHGSLRSAELHKPDESLVLSRSSAVLACTAPGIACHPLPCPHRSLPAPHRSGSTAAPAPKASAHRDVQPHFCISEYLLIPPLFSSPRIDPV